MKRISVLYAHVITEVAISTSVMGPERIPLEIETRVIGILM